MVPLGCAFFGFFFFGVSLVMIWAIDLLLDFCDLLNFACAKIIEKVLYETNNLQNLQMCET
jgi:hypothetical protein